MPAFPSMSFTMAGGKFALSKICTTWNANSGVVPISLCASQCAEERQREERHRNPHPDTKRLLEHFHDGNNPDSHGFAIGPAHNMSITAARYGEDDGNDTSRIEDRVHGFTL